MPSISVGQGDNILSAGQVAMPTYNIGSLSHDQYPCSYTMPDLTERPKPIPLGSFDLNKNYPLPDPRYEPNPSPRTEDLPMVYQNVIEHYDQHQQAGEFSDVTIFVIAGALLLLLILCTYLSFKLKT